MRRVREEPIVWVSARARLRVLGDIVEDLVIGEVGELLRIGEMLRVTHGDGHLHTADSLLVDLVAVALQWPD